MMNTMNAAKKDRKTTSKSNSGNLQLIHKIIEYSLDLLPPPGALEAPPKGKVIATLDDLDKAHKQLQKLTARLKPGVGYYIKSEPTTKRPSSIDCTVNQDTNHAPSVAPVEARH